MRNIYHSRMQEYIEELSKIQEKLERYHKIIVKK
jgi:hypothetical protein